MENAKAAPTGCYKCGRPGHWSRDCTFSEPNPNSDSTPNFSNGNSDRSSSFKASSSGFSKPAVKSTEKPKKVPKVKPKLTPELLVSDDGLGFVLRHFPQNFKYRGRGHEVSDLGNLIGLYKDWHSHLIPYYSFDQFVPKVEQVASSRRVKMCIKDLRERIENGEDPTKLNEDAVKQGDQNNEQGLSTPADGMDSERIDHDGGNTPEAMGSKGVNHGQRKSTTIRGSEILDCEPEDPFLKNPDIDSLHEDMLNDIYNKATDAPSQTMRTDTADTYPVGSNLKEQPNSGASSSEIQMTEDQKARMEANRIKAMERAAARSRLREA